MGDIATGYTGWPNDALQIALENETFVFTASSTVYFDHGDDNQLATGNGYTQVSSSAETGESLASITSSQPSAGVFMLDAANASWTASGGTIGPATDAVILDFTITSPAHPPLFAIDFGASESAGDGTSFNINFQSSGICQII